MLRMRFMPSDFHPVLLILGERDGLEALSGLLSRFAEAGETISLNDNGVFSEDTQVTLAAAGADLRLGLWPEKGGAGSLIWGLSPTKAEEFADEVAKVARGESRAGSATLECEVLNEVVAKVSLGEFEDDFLLGDKW
ncbi:hypothetical protein [Oricola sp.]|jgi:hypothetical protein|uniref:hypothetical protein n=1 Tax=Oricola sp. TaxID=1979950 RepID=UPI003518378E